MATSESGSAGARPTIQINRTWYECPKKSMTGRELRQLPDPPIGPEHDLWRVWRAFEDVKVEDDDVVELSDAPSQFFTTPKYINQSAPEPSQAGDSTFPADGEICKAPGCRIRVSGDYCWTHARLATPPADTEAMGGEPEEFVSDRRSGHERRVLILLAPSSPSERVETNAYGMSMHHRPDGEIGELTVHVHCSRLPEKVIIWLRKSQEKREYLPITPSFTRNDAILLRLLRCTDKGWMAIHEIDSIIDRIEAQIQTPGRREPRAPDRLFMVDRSGEYCEVWSDEKGLAFSDAEDLPEVILDTPEPPGFYVFDGVVRTSTEAEAEGRDWKAGDPYWDGRMSPATGSQVIAFLGLAPSSPAVWQAPEPDYNDNPGEDLGCISPQHKVASAGPRVNPAMAGTSDEAGSVGAAGVERAEPQATEYFTGHSEGCNGKCGKGGFSSNPADYCELHRQTLGPAYRIERLREALEEIASTQDNAQSTSGKSAIHRIREFARAALGTQEPSEYHRALLMEFQDFYQMCTEEEAKVMVDQFFDEQKP